jgi:uncharacterized protein (TIGR02266 family)
LSPDEDGVTSVAIRRVASLPNAPSTYAEVITLFEHRRFVRAPVDVAVIFTGKNNTAEELRGRSKDISVGGMFITTASVVPFGSEVTIRLRLPHAKDELTLPGVVRWVRDDGMGIQFGNLGAKETHEITEVVRRAPR